MHCVEYGIESGLWHRATEFKVDAYRTPTNPVLPAYRHCCIRDDDDA